MDVHKEQSLSSQNFWVQGKTENFFFLAIEFKSSEINSIIVRTSKPRNMLPNVYRHYEFLHSSFWVVAAALVYQSKLRCAAPSHPHQGAPDTWHTEHGTVNRRQQNQANLSKAKFSSLRAFSIKGPPSLNRPQKGKKMLISALGASTAQSCFRGKRQLSARVKYCTKTKVWQTEWSRFPPSFPDS